MQPTDDLPPEDQDWGRFRQLSQLVNHWERPGWAEGRRSYHWFLTFEQDSGLRALAAQCQQPFRDLPQFDLVPLDSLHLTINRLAFTDELPVSGLATAVAVVRQCCRCVAPFRLQIGWLAGSTAAIRFTALPLEPIGEVRAMTTTPCVTAHVRGHTSTRAAQQFWPHVSIAYSNTAQPTGPIAAKIEALRSMPPAEVLITNLALVELRRVGRVYRWEELERFGIDG